MSPCSGGFEQSPLKVAASPPRFFCRCHMLMSGETRGALSHARARKRPASFQILPLHKYPSSHTCIYIRVVVRIPELVQVVLVAAAACVLCTPAGTQRCFYHVPLGFRQLRDGRIQFPLL